MTIKSDFAALDSIWDVIIIGTGMGGSVLGYELARKGKKVLFCEKGRSNLFGKPALRGAHAELLYKQDPKSAGSLSEALLKGGRCNEAIDDVSGEKPISYIPFVGSGTGGSTTLFGTVIQRFSPEDFTPKQNFPGSDESTIPERWPVTYDEMRPYYQKAEALFQAKGQLDPLRNGYLDPIPGRDPIPRGDFAEELFNSFKEKGLHPYQPALACDLIPECTGCQAYACAKNCKNDSSKMCLEPAIRDHGAQLLDECRVLRLNTEGDTVTGVVCEYGDKQIILKAHTVVLAAGSFDSPAILRRSTSREWPDGLANESGMVGQNLMRNFYDLYFLFPENKKGIQKGIKEIYLNDFYTKQYGKLGIAQSFGPVPPIPLIVEDLASDLRDSSFAWMSPLLNLVKPVLRSAFTKKFSDAYIIVTTMEDMPYRDNALSIPQNPRERTKMKYTVKEYDKKRIEMMRSHMTKALEPYKCTVSKQAENNKRFISLACGTCRFGDDPATSVLDRNNKAHGLGNLYVVDSSFFPSNPALNSGLTIAANALRVADKAF